jgi:hypothetical protein
MGGRHRIELPAQIHERLFQHRHPVAEAATFGVPGPKRRFEVFGPLIRGGELLSGQAQALLDSRRSRDHALLAIGELSNAGFERLFVLQDRLLVVAAAVVRHRC